MVIPVTLPLFIMIVTVGISPITYRVSVLKHACYVVYNIYGWSKESRTGSLRDLYRYSSNVVISITDKIFSTRGKIMGIKVIWHSTWSLTCITPLMSRTDSLVIAAKPASCVCICLHVCTKCAALSVFRHQSMVYLMSLWYLFPPPCFTVCWD